MKRYWKSLGLLCVGMIAAASVSAQEIGDLLRFSQYNYSFSTPRSAALGGAFTSLGADLSSMSINPAGLGMYRSSEMMLAPQVSIGKMDGNYYGNSFGDSKSTFSIGSMGAAFNVSQRSHGVVSFTLGVGYNKLVDYNTSSTIRGYGDRSMLGYMAETVDGIEADLLARFPDPFNSLDLYQWGGILGYQTYLLDETTPGSSRYAPQLLPGTTTNNTLRNVNKGSVGEYSISGGFNVNNVFYFGLTMGIQDLYYKNENIYSEIPVEDQQPEGINNWRYRRTNIAAGTGMNMKLGIIVRPVSNLRIGVAVHTPTWSWMEDKYIEDMLSVFNQPNNNGSYYDSPPRVFNYRMNTAPRLLTGVSYAFPGIGLISFDYERVWYNGIRIKDTDFADYEDDMKDMVRDNLRAANNFRVGIEVTPTPNLFIRGGYAYYDKNFKYDDMIASNRQEVNQYHNFTGGIGYRFGGNISVDLAYVYTDYKYLNSELYPYAADTGSLIKTGQNRHTIMASIGYRF